MRINWESIACTSKNPAEKAGFLIVSILNLWYNTKRNMKKFGDIFVNDFDLKKQAEELGVSVWKTPSFLFIIMGLVVVLLMAGVYWISKDNPSPEILVASECLVVIFIMSIGSSIIRSMEQMAKVNKIKSEFVSIISHQLKTPPTEINWQLEYFIDQAKKDLSEEQLGIISNISRSNSKIVNLTNDLLEVVNIDKGDFVLRENVIDIVKIIEGVINDFLHEAKFRNVEMFFQKGCVEALVMGDEKKIKSAISKLIENAIHYIKGKGRVEISINQEDKSVLFAVKDNGVGIPQSQQERVFEKFFRSDNTVKYRTEGIGLGLFLAKNVIEKSKGRIWFESKEGEGSTFYFSLPVFEK